MGRYAIFNGLVYGGGTNVIPNPEGTPTEELHSIQIDEDIYEIVGGGSSGEGYSETLLYKYENGTTVDGIKTLNDDITNYDLLLFRLVFNVPTYTDHIISVSALEQVGYISNPVATGPHVSIVSYASDYIRIVEGETKNKINIFEINGNEYIDEIYGIKIEGGGGSIDKVTKVYDIVPSGEGCSIVVAEHIWLSDSGGSVSYSTAEYPDITSVDNFVARLTQTAMDDGSRDYDTNITFTFDDTNKTIEMSWGTLSGSSGCYVDIVYSLVEPVVVASDVEISNTSTVTYDISSIIPAYQTLASKDFMFNLKHIYSDNDGLGTSSPFNINFNSNTGVLTVSWNDIGTNNVLTGDILLLYKEDGYKLIKDMQPPTETSSGYHGYVPAPKIGDENKFLRGDGTWSESGGSSTNVQRLSPEAYNALPQSEKENGTIYFVHKNAGETTISGTFTTGSIQYEKVIVDCGFKPTSISVILPFSNGDTYAEYDEAVSTTTSTWEIPMESQTYTIILGSETGESGITDILDNGFKFRCNASNTRNVNCTFEATGVLDNEINKIYYMGDEYTGDNSSGDGSQELISYDTTITTTQYGWWTAEDKDGNVLDPDQYELIAVTPVVNNSPSWTGAWDGAFFINTVDGVTYRYDVSFVNINDGGYIRTSRTWDVKVVYRDKNAAGGGGGSTVVPNPEEEPTDTLNTIEIDGVVYNIEGGSEGEGVEIYSEDEYIVGKWIDGKKLYQKTIIVDNPIMNNVTTVDDMLFTDCQIIEIKGYGVRDASAYSAGDIIYPINTFEDNNYSCRVVFNAQDGKIAYQLKATGNLFSKLVITLRYTKTVETPAPAWGGSVTNNYANFIDTDNVIYSGVYNPTTPLSYTAIEDCFMVIVLIASNNPCIVSVNNKEIYRLYDNGVSSITVPVPIKKGQTITATTSYSSEDSPYTVYGISYASGGSENGTSLVDYSTSEKIVGTWLDGSSIYQKTFVLSSPIVLTSGDWTVISEVNVPNADASIYTEVFYSSNKTQLTAAGKFDNGVLSIFLPFTFRTDKVTVRYTKTTT